MYQRFTKTLVILNLQKRKWNNTLLASMLSQDNFQNSKISLSIIVPGTYGFSFITKFMMCQNSNILVIFWIKYNLIYRRHWDISAKLSHGRHYIIWRYQSFCKGARPYEKLLYWWFPERWRGKRALGPVCKEEGTRGTGST